MSIDKKVEGLIQSIMNKIKGANAPRDVQNIIDKEISEFLKNEKATDFNKKLNIPNFQIDKIILKETLAKHFSDYSEYESNDQISNLYNELEESEIAQFNLLYKIIVGKLKCKARKLNTETLKEISQERQNDAYEKERRGSVILSGWYSALEFVGAKSLDKNVAQEEEYLKDMNRKEKQIDDEESKYNLELKNINLHQPLAERQERLFSEIQKKIATVKEINEKLIREENIAEAKKILMQELEQGLSRYALSEEDQRDLEEKCSAVAETKINFSENTATAEDLRLQKEDLYNFIFKKLIDENLDDRNHEELVEDFKKVIKQICGDEYETQSNLDSNAVLMMARNLFGASPYGENVTVQQAAKLSAHMSLIYNSQKGEKFYNEKGATLEAVLEKQKKDINDVAEKFPNKEKQEQVSLAENQIIIEIREIENKRKKEIEEKILEYNKSIKNLILNTRGIKDKRYTISHPLDEETELYKSIKETKQAYEEDIKKINRKEEYILNRMQAQNLSYLAECYLPSKEIVSHEDLCKKFKEKVTSFREQDKADFIALKENDSKIQQVKQELKSIKEEEENLEKTKSKLPDYRSAEEAKKIESYDNEVERLQQNNEVQESTLKALTKEKFFLQRKKRLNKAKRHFEKNVLLGLSQQSLAVFEKYKNDSISGFDEKMKSLSKKNLPGLYQLAYNVIATLPALGIPEVNQKNKYRYQYSRKKLIEMQKAYVVLEQAKRAAEQDKEDDPYNPIKIARFEEIDQAFDVLSHKLRIHSPVQAVMGFDLLLPETQEAFRKSASEIDFDDPKQKNKIAQFYNEVWWAVEGKKQEMAEKNFWNPMVQKDRIIRRLNEEGYEDIKKGIINHYITLEELKAMFFSVERYLLDEKHMPPELAQQKKNELNELKQQIEQMEKKLGEDLTQAVSLVKVAKDTDAILTELSNNVSHYMTKGFYFAGGLAAGTAVGKFGEYALSFLPGSAARVASYFSTGAGVIIGAKVGVESGKSATAYDDANLSSTVSDELKREIKRHKETFKANRAKEVGQDVAGVVSNVGVHVVAGTQVSKNSIKQTIAGLIKDNPKLFWGGMIFLGVGISIVTMGAAAPALGITGVTLLATYAGAVGVGAAAGAGSGALIHKKMNEDTKKKTYKAVSKKYKSASKKVKIPQESIDKISDENLKALLVNLNQHMEEQLGVIKQHIKKINPKNQEDNKKYYENITYERRANREIAVLEKMETLKKEIEKELLRSESNPNAEKIKTKIEHYIENIYEKYHKEHITDTFVDHRDQERQMLNAKSKMQSQKRKMSAGTRSRKSYVEFELDQAKKKNRKKTLIGKIMLKKNDPATLKYQRARAKREKIERRKTQQEKVIKNMHDLKQQL